MKRTPILKVIAFAFAIGSVFAPASKAQNGCPARSNVGFKIVSIADGAKMAIWYPTDEAERPHNYSPDLHGSATLNAAISKCERFPLVIFSHALDACGTQSIFITEGLARYGYVVAAPDHKDATCHVDGTGQFKLNPSQRPFVKPDTWTESTYLDRRRDIENAIDWVLKSPEFSSSVDPARIAAAGHSLGGYVVLGMVGAWKSWKDPRIKAALLFSPYAAPYLSHDRLRGVDVPVMYQGAQLDLGITPFLKGKSGAYALSASPEKFYVELKGGNHLEWTNLLCSGNMRIPDCGAAKLNAKLIVSYSAMFLDRVFKNDRSAQTSLRGAGLATYNHN